MMWEQVRLLLSVNTAHASAERSSKQIGHSISCRASTNELPSAGRGGRCLEGVREAGVAVLPDPPVWTDAASAIASCASSDDSASALASCSSSDIIARSLDDIARGGGVAIDVVGEVREGADVRGWGGELVWADDEGVR